MNYRFNSQLNIHMIDRTQKLLDIRPSIELLKRHTNKLYSYSYSNY